MPSPLSLNEAIAGIVKPGVGVSLSDLLKKINETPDEVLLIQLGNEQFQFSFGKPGQTANHSQGELFERIQSVKDIKPLTVAKWAVILNQIEYLQNTSPYKRGTPPTPVDTTTANALLPLATFYNKPRGLAAGSLFRPDSQGSYPIITFAQYDAKNAAIEVRVWQDAEVQDEHIAPLLHQAIQSKNSILIKALFAHQAIQQFIKKTPIPEDIKTLLHEAVQTNELAIVELLLETGIPNQPNEQRRYPLSYAAQQGNADIFNHLVAFSKEGIDLPDQQQRTPLSYAAENGCLEIVQQLDPGQTKGFKEKDNSGTTPYGYAEKNKHTEITDYFSRKNEPLDEQTYHTINYEDEIKLHFPRYYIQLKQLIDKKPNDEEREAEWGKAHRIFSSDEKRWSTLPNETIYQSIARKTTEEVINEMEMQDSALLYPFNLKALVL